MSTKLPGQRYHLEQCIQEGVQGEVWRALDRLRQQRVAIKITLPESPSTLMYQERAALRLLDLPGVVRLVDDGLCSDGRYFLVTDWIEGTPLHQLPRPCSWEQLKQPLTYCLATLQLIHGAGIVHRDLKPGHILLLPDQKRTAILDFGLACGRGATLARSPQGGILGSLAYAAPEQLSDPESATPRSDLYALGMILYELISGKHPFADAKDLYMTRLTTQAPPLHIPGIGEVIERMLQKAPRKRPESASEVMRTLGLHLGDPALSAWNDQLWPDTTLKGVFAGPERIFGLQTSSVACLKQRAGRLARRQAEELGAWLSWGFAAWDQGAVRVSTEQVMALAYQSRLRGLAARNVTETLDASERAVMGVVDALWPLATRARIQAVLGDSSLVNTLEKRGDLVWMDEERLEVSCTYGSQMLEDALQTRCVQALPVGSMPWLMLQLRHPQAGEAVVQAVELAEQEGRFGLAFRLVGVGLTWARGASDHGVMAQLLDGLTRSALAAGTPRALELGLYELDRARIAEEDGRRRLLQAMLAVRRGRLELALGLLEALRPQTLGSLERWRLVIQAELPMMGAAADRVDQSMEDAWRWAKKQGTEAAIGDVEGWEGLLSYKRLDMQRAVVLAQRAGQKKERLSGKLSAWCNEAAAQLELGAFAQVEGLAHQTMAKAREIQQTQYIARAEWLLRNAAWRQGKVREVDWELIEAARQLRGMMGGQLLFGEFAIAWRASFDARRDQGVMRGLAQQLSQEVLACWGESKNKSIVWLARCCHGALQGDGALETLLGALEGLEMPGLGVQGLGLLGWEFPSRHRELLPTINLFCEQIPTVMRVGRRELMSLEEALAGGPLIS